MKSRLIIISFLVAALLFSCKNEKTKTDSPEEKKDTFKVTLDLVIKKDDSLQLFYTEDNSMNWVEEQSVWAAVKGSEGIQAVQFELPSEAFPSNIRLDFGTNRNQSEIAVKKYEMEFAGNKFSVNDTLFYQYFIPVNQIEWDRKNAVAKINAPKDAVYDPSFNPRENLNGEIMKLVK